VQSRKWYLLYSGQDVSQPPVYIHEASQNWDWDGQPTKWWHAWLVLYCALISTGSSGGGVSVSAASGGFVTVTGLSGMTSADVGRWLFISGAATPANNGSFQIVKLISASSVLIANSVGTSDANNGSLLWETAAYRGFAPQLACGTPGLKCGTPGLKCGVRSDGDTAAIFTTIRQLLRTWKSNQTYYRWIVVSFNGGDGSANTDYSPYSTDTTGDHNPDGTWRHWSKTVNGHRVSARVTKTYLDAGRRTHDAFVSGTGRYVDSYEHSQT